MAFDSYSACSTSTCVWVPYSEDKTFTHGHYTFTVDTKDKNETDGVFRLLQDNKILLSTPLRHLSASVSVVWSPNDSGFSLTWSDGGAIGMFRTRVFLLEKGLFVEKPITSFAFTDFKKRHFCRARGDNIQAYNWPSPNSILLVMSVYPTSDCGADMGHLEAYLVSTTNGTILQRMTADQFMAYSNSHPQ